MEGPIAAICRYDPSPQTLPLARSRRGPTQPVEHLLESCGHQAGGALRGLGRRDGMDLGPDLLVAAFLVGGEAFAPFGHPAAARMRAVLQQRVE